MNLVQNSQIHLLPMQPSISEALVRIRHQNVNSWY